MTIAVTMRITERNEWIACLSNNPSTDFHFSWTSYWKELHGIGLKIWGAWLAQSLGHDTLKSQVHEFKTYVGHGAYFKKKKLKKIILHGKYSKHFFRLIPLTMARGFT